MYILKRTVHFLLVLITSATVAHAQEKQLLQPGDAAPPLKYAKWLQGPNPIASIENNKTYVIEFWATWCGPCIAAMPHLSELAKKYEGKIDFIGCDVMENSYGGPKDQELYLPKVSSFVKDQFKSGRLTYNIIMDNTAEDMNNNWLKAAGIGGIPTTFLIEQGKIAWIGHPIYLDSIITAMHSGKYDVNEEREKRIARDKKMAAMSAGFKAATDEYKAAEAAKDYTKALRLIDSAIAKFPDNRYTFTTDKFMLLLHHFSEEKAIAWGRELQKDKLPGQVLIANLYKEDGLSKKVYEFAAEAVKGWKMNNGKALDILASFEARSGNFKAAAETQLKAIESAKAEKDNPGMTESVIMEMQKKADEYQQKAKVKK